MRILLVATTSFSLYLCFIFSNNAKYFLAATRLWEFLAGAWLALDEDLISRTKVSSRIFQGAGIAMLVVMAVIIPEFLNGSSFPNLLTIPVVATTTYILWCNRPIEIHSFNLIGNWSYSIYLYHWPILRFLDILTPSSDYAWVVAAVILTLAAAFLSYHMVEQRLSQFLAIKWSILGWIALTVVSAAIIYAVSRGAIYETRISATPPRINISHPSNQSGNPWILTKETHFISSERLTLLATNSPDPPWPEVKYNASDPRCIYIWGDSHAMSLRGMIIYLAEYRHVRIINMARPPSMEDLLLLNETVEYDWYREGSFCGYLPRNLPYFEECKRKLIFVSTVTNLWNRNVKNETTLYTNMVTTLRGFSEQNACVVAMEDNPNWVMQQNTRRTVCDVRCVVTSKPPLNECWVWKNESTIRFEQKLGSLEIRNVHTWSPEPYICDKLRCWPNYDIIPIYLHDGNHLGSNFAYNVLGPAFEWDVFGGIGKRLACVREFLTERMNGHVRDHP
jgi:hypothetical protein